MFGTREEFRAIVVVGYMEDKSGPSQELLDTRRRVQGPLNCFWIQEGEFRAHSAVV